MGSGTKLSIYPTQEKKNNQLRLSDIVRTLFYFYLTRRREQILDAVRKIPPDVLACFHNFANLGDVADLDRPTTHSSALQSPAKLIQPIRTGWSIPDRGRRQSNVSGSETIATGGNLTLKGPTGGPTVTAGSGVGGNSSGTGGAGGTAITGNTTGGTSISKGGSTGDGGSAGGGTGGGHGEGTGTGGSGGIGGKGV